MEVRVNNYGEVAGVAEELHYFFSGAGLLGPAGFCVGILFEGAKGLAVELEVDLAEAAARGAFYGVGVAVEGYGGEVFEHGLAEDGEQRFFEGGGHEDLGSRCTTQFTTGEASEDAALKTAALHLHLYTLKPVKLSWRGGRERLECAAWHWILSGSSRSRATAKGNTY